MPKTRTVHSVAGRITTWHAPGGPGVRVIRTLHQPLVPPNYDSMIGKIIVHGDTREQALACMRTALSETVIEGINTNAAAPRADGGRQVHGWWHQHPLSGRVAVATQTLGCVQTPRRFAPSECRMAAPFGKGTRHFWGAAGVAFVRLIPVRRWCGHMFAETRCLPQRGFCV